MAIFCFVFEAGQGVVHWIFGFKYWVISQEIPNALKVISPEELDSNERKYKVIEYMGISVNVFFGLIQAILRAILDYGASQK